MSLEIQNQLGGSQSSDFVVNVFEKRCGEWVTEGHVHFTSIQENGKEGTYGKLLEQSTLPLEENWK